MQPNPMISIQDGFCFTVKCRVETGVLKVFINVCGHPDIGPPQHKNGTEIQESYLDTQGLDNLGIPIDVGPLHRETLEGKENKGECCFVDVLVSCAISKRVRDREHHLFPLLTSRLMTLALHWVKAEHPSDLGGIEEVTAKLLHNVKRKTGSKTKQMESVHKKAESMYDEMVEKQKKKDEELHEEMATSKIPASFNLLNKDDGFGHGGSGGERKKQEEPANVKKKGAMVVELDGSGTEEKVGSENKQDPTTSATQSARNARPETSTPAVKKGFFNDAKTSLYPPEGTSEGVLPDGAGDPLGYLPKQLRSKVKAIDLRGEEGQAFLKRSQDAVDAQSPSPATGSVASAFHQSPDGRFQEPHPEAEKGPDVPPQQPPMSGGITFSTINSTETKEPETATVSSVSPPNRGSWPFTVERGTSGSLVISVDVPEHITSMGMLDLSIDTLGLDLKEEITEDGSVTGGAWTRVSLVETPIDADTATAKFLKKSHKLKVTVGLLR